MSCFVSEHTIDMSFFQAVIMAAGQGSRLEELTTHTPKALLPVANLPLIWYPINMLQKASYTHAIVIVTEDHNAAIQKALADIPQVKISLEFVAIPADSNDWGTAQSLRHIAPRIKKPELLVVTCDVISDLPLLLPASLHRRRDATLTVVMAPIQEGLEQTPVAGGKAHRRIEKDYVGLEDKADLFDKEKCLVYYQAESEIEEDSLSVPMSFFKKHPVVNWSNNLLDAHVYFMKRWVLDYLNYKPNISTIKGELIPRLVQKKERKIDGAEESIETPSDPENYNDLKCVQALLDSLSDQVSKYSISDKGPVTKSNKLNCFAYVLDENDKFYCTRANNMALYCDANKQVPRHLMPLEESDEQPQHPGVHPSLPALHKSTTVGPDSIIGENTTIGERITIKKSMIGKNCVIKDKVKIVNSVIMDGAGVEEYCNISGSVIGSRATISEKCELKETIVTGEHVLPKGKKCSNEAVAPEGMMEFI